MSSGLRMDVYRSFLWQTEVMCSRRDVDGLADDTQMFFEWIPVIGAHGAHPY